MRRIWKKAAAFGLAVLVGAMMPMGTMLAEEDAGTKAGSVSENDAIYAEESISEKETAAEVVTDDLPQENTALTASATEPDVELNGAEPPENMAAPVITITRDGNDCTSSLGGKITFEYVKYWGPQIAFSVQSDRSISVFWYLDRITDLEAEAKTEEQMDSLSWTEQQSLSETVCLSQDGNYVIYVKVEAGTQKYYARSNGIIVDTQKPVIKEAVSGQPLVSGQTYPKETRFVVEDANLKTVLVNQQSVDPENGSYAVTAKENSTACEIKAIDEAGNEETCSITISGTETPEPKPEEPETPDESNVISKNGEYALKAGVKYHLAEGKWKVSGDKSVYRGDRDFYVTVDGSYQFSK